MLFHQLRVYVVELRYAYSGRFANIWVFVFESFAKGLAEVLRDLVYSNAAHCAHR